MTTTQKTMAKKVRIKKAFTFSYPGTATVTDPATGKITAHATAGYSKEFVPGDEVEITDEMLTHPWILAGADGAIDSADTTDAEKAAEKDAAAADAAVREATAKAASARANAATVHAKAASDAANKKEAAPASTPLRP